MKLKPDLSKICSVNATLIACLLAASLACSPALLSAANEVAEKASQLDLLRQRIKKLQHQFTKKRGKQQQAEKSLRKTELEISDVAQKLKQTDADLSRLENELNYLDKEKTVQATLLDRQKNRLVQEMRSVYIMGHQHHLKLLLNQQQPAQMSRMLTYAGYLSAARASSINQIKRQLEQMQALQNTIHEKTAALTAFKQQEKAHRNSLKQRMKKRQTIVASLDRELVAEDNRLAGLKADEKQLKVLIHSLREAWVDIPKNPSRQASLKTMKGQLKWPARGVLSQSFGTRLAGTGLKSRGVLIKAPEGGQVRSVSHGRVAFADWLKGFGLLLIIDHGDGYMSLYGHNQALYKEVGEWVDSSEVIAALGQSGGFSKPGLYFELRFKGQPVDPAKWCAGRPRAVSG